MARAGKKNVSPRGIVLALAFAGVAAVSYSIGAARAPKTPPPVAQQPPAPGYADEPVPAEQAALELFPAPAPAVEPPPPDTATVVLAPPPAKRPPRDILVVGKPPGWVPDPPDAAPPPEPPPPVVADVPPAPPSPPPPVRVTSQDLVHSIFDEDDRIDRHPVPDRGPLTKSSFDEDDKVDRHPVP